MDMKGAGELFRLLGDEVRLRLLRVLAGRHGRLNVTELTAVLGHRAVRRVAASAAAEGRWASSSKSAAAAFRSTGCRLRCSMEASAGCGRRCRRSSHKRTIAAAAREDDARLQEVIRLRKENFNVHGTDRAQLVPGRSWAAWSRALGLLLPALDVADIACGEGYLSVESARWAKRVIGIDRSSEVLKRAKGAGGRAGG